MKKIRTKKIVALILAMATAALLATGCGSAGPGTPASTTGAATAAQTTAAAAAEPVVLNFFSEEFPGYPLIDDTCVLKQVTEKTGVKIHWIPGPAQNLEDKINLIMSSGDLPDLMCISIKQLNNYALKGAFYDLGSLADKYAPNLKKYMTPKAIMSVLCGDKKYYGIPQQMDRQQNRIAWLVRKDWMGKLNITKDPDNLDEYAEMLRAFKDTDFDGNGKKDTIPLCTRSGGLNLVTKLFAPTFGLTPIDLDVGGMTVGKDGKMFFNSTSENLKQMLTWLNMLYKEGLLDQEYPTRSTQDWEQLTSANMVAASLDFGSRGDSVTAALVKTDPDAEFGAIQPCVGPFGDRGVVDYNQYEGLCSIGVTKSCKNVEAAMKFLDYWFSDEGSEITTIGVKGVTYTDIVDGKAQFIDEIKSDPTNISVQAKYGILPQMMSCRGDCRLADDILFGKIYLESEKLNAPYWKDMMPTLNYTPEENDKITQLYSQFSPVINEYLDKFITGAIPMSEWDSYVDKVNKLGVPEYTQMLNAAYTRLAADEEYVKNTYK